MERPAIKDVSVLAYMQFLEDELGKFKNSPYSKTYLTILKQVENFNEQLNKNNIDLFSDKEDKSFDRTKWYFENVLELNRSLLELRKMMSPSEKEAIDNKMPLAEKIVKQNGNGKNI